jgi:hypothetical protein
MPYSAKVTASLLYSQRAAGTSEDTPGREQLLAAYHSSIDFSEGTLTSIKTHPLGGSK